MKSLVLTAIFVLGTAHVALADDAPAAERTRPLPVLKNEPLGSVQLGESTLSIEADRKPPDTRAGLETMEPGSIGRKPKSSLGPQFFGLSLKKALQ